MYLNVSGPFLYVLIECELKRGLIGRNTGIIGAEPCDMQPAGARVSTVANYGGVRQLILGPGAVVVDACIGQTFVVAANISSVLICFGPGIIYIRQIIILLKCPISNRGDTVGNDHASQAAATMKCIVWYRFCPAKFNAVSPPPAGPALVKPLQPAKTSSLMAVTLSGMVTLVKLLHL